MKLWRSGGIKEYFLTFKGEFSEGVVEFEEYFINSDDNFTPNTVGIADVK